jgi:hypothetical protein
MGKSIAAMVLAGSLGIAAVPSLADENESSSPAELAKALPQAKVSLEQGLKASAKSGRPISGKYEIEDGALQLSIYTAKGDQFTEVIVAHKSGTIKKAEKITDSDDLKDAKEQSGAMAKAKVPLAQAIDKAMKANGGYRAVKVEPMLKGGKPIADVTLMKGATVKKVAEKLD